MIVKMWKIETGAAYHWVFAETEDQVKEIMTNTLEEQLGAGSIDQLEALEEMEIHELTHDDEFRFTTSHGRVMDFDIGTWVDLFYAFTDTRREPTYFACSEW